jgi:ribosomal protein L2
MTDNRPETQDIPESLRAQQAAAGRIGGSRNTKENLSKAGRAAWQARLRRAREAERRQAYEQANIREITP